MRKSILIILLSIFVLSCHSDDENSEMTNIEFTLIAKGDLYVNGAEGIVEQNLIISQQTAWSNLITQMDSIYNVSDNFVETDINFSEYTIIAVFDEVKGNAGHDLDLNIMSDSENIIVNVTDLAPEGNATTVITQPFYIAKIHKSDLSIIFE